MVESTRLNQLSYAYIEQKRLKVGDSSHLTASFIGPFIISERVGQGLRSNIVTR